MFLDWKPLWEDAFFFSPLISVITFVLQTCLEKELPITQQLGEKWENIIVAFLQVQILPSPNLTMVKLPLSAESVAYFYFSLIYYLLPQLILCYCWDLIFLSLLKDRNFCEGWFWLMVGQLRRQSKWNSSAKFIICGKSVFFLVRHFLLKCLLHLCLQQKAQAKNCQIV